MTLTEVRVLPNKELDGFTLDKKSKVSEIGQRIKHFREEAGLTQEEFAKLAGVATITVGTYERGERRPTPKMINKIIDNVGISYYRLTGKRRHSSVENITTTTQTTRINHMYNNELGVSKGNSAVTEQVARLDALAIGQYLKDKIKDKEYSAIHSLATILFGDKMREKREDIIREVNSSI